MQEELLLSRKILCCPKERNAKFSVFAVPDYYKPQKPKEGDLALMQAIDRQYLKTPFYGRRRMTVEMRKLGFRAGQKKIRTVSN